MDWFLHACKISVIWNKGNLPNFSHFLSLNNAYYRRGYLLTTMVMSFKGLGKEMKYYFKNTVFEITKDSETKPLILNHRYFCQLRQAADYFKVFAVNHF